MINKKFHLTVIRKIMLILIAMSSLFPLSCQILEDVTSMKQNSIKNNLNLIDHSETNFQAVLSNLKNDTNFYSFNNSEYSALDYFILKLFISGNKLNCQRIKFLEFVLIKRNEEFNSDVLKSFKFYSLNEIDSLKIMERKFQSDSTNTSLVPSLILSLQILKDESTDDFQEFSIRINSYYNKYYSLRNEYNDFRLLLPMCTLLTKWKSKFPNTTSEDLIAFLDSRVWDNFEYNVLYSFVVDLFNQLDKKCISRLNIDEMIVAYWTANIVPDLDFSIVKNNSKCRR